MAQLFYKVDHDAVSTGVPCLLCRFGTGVRILYARAQGERLFYTGITDMAQVYEGVCVY